MINFHLDCQSPDSWHKDSRRFRWNNSLIGAITHTCAFSAMTTPNGQTLSNYTIYRQRFLTHGERPFQQRAVVHRFLTSAFSPITRSIHHTWHVFSSGFPSGPVADLVTLKEMNGWQFPSNPVLTSQSFTWLISTYFHYWCLVSIR